MALVVLVRLVRAVMIMIAAAWRRVIGPSAGSIKAARSSAAAAVAASASATWFRA